MTCCGGEGNAPATANTLTGKYERHVTDNYEDYLAALDVNIVMRKALAASNPTLSVCREGQRWCFETSTALKSWTSWFTPGTPFDETTIDGREVSSVVELEGETKFVINQRAKKAGEKTTKVVREFKGNELIETDSIEGLSIVCTQRYKKLNWSGTTQEILIMFVERR